MARARAVKQGATAGTTVNKIPVDKLKSKDKIGVNDLLNLADMIENKKLRRKVRQYIKEAAPIHPEFSKNITDLQETPAAEDWHHAEPGGLVVHTYTTTVLAIYMAEIYSRVYGEDVDLDTLVASSLVHDLSKVAIYRKADGGWGYTDVALDAVSLSIADLYSRGFPKSVIECVAAHHGEHGPIQPFDTVSKILHYADMFDAFLNETASEGLTVIPLETIIESLMMNDVGEDNASEYE